MKKILCYGDSNTYGFIPQQFSRYKENERWSGILKTKLFKEYQVIEAGMNNRTGFFKNNAGFEFSTQEHLPIFLNNYPSIDICILAVGTNDFQFTYKIDGKIIETGLENLIKIIKDKNNNTKIIILPPVRITEDIKNGIFIQMFNKNSIENINKYFYLFEEIAKKHNEYYFDLNKIASPSKLDGLHYTKDSHSIIAEHLVKFILEI